MVRHLVALMSRHDLSEIDLRDGDLRIRLRRGQEGLSGSAAAQPRTAAPSGVPREDAPVTVPASETGQAGKALKTITSPTPGTFYAAASPDAEPFVHVGSRVAPDPVVCV